MVLDFQRNLYWASVVFLFHTRCGKLPVFCIPLLTELPCRWTANVGPGRHKTLERFAQEYGDVVHIRLVSVPFLMISNADIAKSILRQNRTMLRSPRTYDHLQTFCAKSIFFIRNPEEWASTRKMLNPVFTSEVNLSFLFPSMKSGVEEFFARVDSTQGRIHDLQEDICDLTFEVIMRTSVSLHLPLGTSELNRNVDKILGIYFSRLAAPIPWHYYLPLPSVRKYQDLVHQAESYIDDIIEKRQAETKEESRRRGNTDFLDLLLQAADNPQMHNVQLPKNWIRDNLLVFITAGQDTTASVLNWAVYNLTQHPDIQAKARAEVDSFLKDKGGNRGFDFEDMSSLPYIQAFLMENMRLFPASPAFNRETTEDTFIDGRPVPAKTVLLINIWSINRDPREWGETALDFQPERWLGMGIEEWKNKSFLTFSAGPRVCIGARFSIVEQTLFLATLLRDYNIECTNVDSPQMAASFTFKANPPIEIQLTRRTPPAL